MSSNGATAVLRPLLSPEKGDESRERIIDVFRRWGYLQADLDPLGRLTPVAVPQLDVFGQQGAFARRFYCAAIGAEFMHVPDEIGHELRAERARRKDDRTAIVSIEQLVPFPFRELAEELGHHSTASELVWVQEEPANMGARAFMMPRLRRLRGGRPVRSVRRSASASPATGSSKAHDIEQQTLIAMAFAT